MSDRDSFIDEVADEVRRDKLFRLMRRYGWIAVLLILLIVAGAAVNEWRKDRARRAAEAKGDAVLSALEDDTPAGRARALEAIPAEGSAAAVLKLLAAAQTVDEESRAAAIDRLEAVARNGDLPRLWTDLAVLKAAILRGSELPPEERIARLEPLTLPGSPFRPLALEQIALARIDAGETETAIETLTGLLQDADAPQGLRARAQQLIVALGGELETL